MSIIPFSENKSLKLLNVLSCEFSMNESDSFQHCVISMENYLKSKGATFIGPSFRKLNTV